MSIEATATALAQDEGMVEQEQVNPTEEMSEDDALRAVFDKMSKGENLDDEPEQQPEQGEVSDDEPEGTEPEAEVEEAPSELPLAIKKNWSAIPSEARDAFLEAQRESNRKLGEQGRLMQGIAPIRDVLTEAVKTLPSLSNMTPQQVAKEVFMLAQTSHEFNSKPIETMMGLVKKHGLERAMAEALSGQGVTQGAQQESVMTREISRLKEQLARLTDPEYMESQFSSFSTKYQTEQTVQEFASSKPDWADVEVYMPQAISFVQGMAPDASAQDVLSRAYDLALGQVKPDAIKAKEPEAAPKAALAADPERSRKAQKAKSINVNGQAPGKPRPQTEDELLSAIWAKNQS